MRPTYLLFLHTETDSVPSGGGADGSLMIFRDIETTFHPNIGLDEVVASFLPFQQRSNMTAADL